MKVTAASLLPVSAARVTARPFFLDALNIPVPSIAFITGLLESYSKGIYRPMWEYPV